MQNALDEVEKLAAAEQTQDSSIYLKIRLNRIAGVNDLLDHL